MSDPVKAIAGRLRPRCDRFATLHVDRAESHAWRSLLFDGARHDIRLRLAGPAVMTAMDALRAALDDPDFTIAGHIVAEMRVGAVERDGEDAILTLDALTIEAP